MTVARFSAATKALAGALFALGLVTRIAPLFNQGGRLLAQWPTEDGYFMLTMGRNVALGHGLSVAGGEMPTNGTQPLTTLLWALGFSIVGPDRSAGVLFALVFQVIAGLVMAYLIFRLAKRVFGPSEHASVIALLAAAFWFASPVALSHTMNCLETGLAGLVATAIALAFVEVDEEPELWSWPRTLAFGVLLGVGFWVRNDLAFMIFAACVCYLWPALKRRESFRPRLGRVLVFGSTSVVVASPWLIYNYLHFGHIMPVSGRAEALSGYFGSNLMNVPTVVAEYLGGVIPIPHAISSHVPVIIAALIFVVAVVASLARRFPSLSPPEQRLVRLGSVYVSLLALFYGVYFGAGWFLSRYFFPTSGLLILLTAGLYAHLRARVPEGRRQALDGALSVSLLVIIALLSVRQYRKGDNHPHLQVVEWVEQNASEETWVGAVQTGTLGYFHDRTINLDGKVNIAAYEALVEDRIGEYVVNDTEIEYLADWVGMRDWLTKPTIAAAFELVVADEEQNLGVLGRKH